MDADLAVSFAERVEQLGIVGILVLTQIWVCLLYLRERRENSKLHAEILSNNREMITTMVTMQAAITGHTQVLGAVNETLRRLSEA